MQQLKQLQEQQKLIGAIALNIRKSLKFQDIFATSVKEVRQLLKADRVLVYQFTHQMQGKVVAESVLPQWTPTLGFEIEDTDFQQSQGEEYYQGKIWAATNIYEAGLSDHHIQILEQFQVKANLVVPILLENQETPAVEWGLFIVHQCSAPRQWQTFEVEFLNQLTVQLAIAIQQAQLHHNLQTLKAELEAKVEERTTALQESDRQKAEETLRQSEERWQLAIAGTDEGIWDWDISTNQTFRSERWFTILGYEPNELSDRDDEWSIRIHPDDYTRVIAAQKAYLLGQVADYNLEYRLRCKDGSYRWVRSRAKAIWNEQGNPVRLVGSLEDISERKQAEEKLQQSEAQLATTQQIAHVGSWEWNLETKKCCWS